MSYRNHRNLGRTGMSVSRLGIGSGYGVPSTAVERAFHDYGINYLYWSLSRRGGMTRAIRNLSPHHRDELVIVGPKNDAEMGHALSVLDSEPLTADELERIRRIGDHVHG